MIFRNRDDAHKFINRILAKEIGFKNIKAFKAYTNHGLVGQCMAYQVDEITLSNFIEIYKRKRQRTKRAEALGKAL